MSSKILFPTDDDEELSEGSLVRPTFHCSQTLSYLSIPSPYAGSNFPAIAAACAAMVAAFAGNRAIQLSWGLWVALFMSLFLVSSLICYWQSGKILLNRYSNLIDIEKRLSKDLQARRNSRLSAAEEGNLKSILYRLNVQGSDLESIGLIRHISPGYRKVESSIDELRSRIENLCVCVSDDDPLFTYRDQPIKRASDKLDKRLGELLCEVKKISKSQQEIAFRS
ncbi:MAG: hypothetical protein OXC19_21290 [Bryobacterales bacterium]|nr:hypothetical protein [Bryobacterales bacterium]